MDRSSRPSWRKKGPTAAPPLARGAAPPLERGGSSWRSRRTEAAGSTVLYQRLRLGILLLAALGLAVAFVLALIWTGKETPIVAARVLHYPPSLPPNSYAEEDLQRLLRIDQASDNLRVVREDESRGWRGSQYLDYLRQQLDQLRPGGPRKDVLVVMLSAHGAVDEANQPCLLFSDAQPLDSRTWVPLDQLLEVLREHQARGGWRPPKLLLVLDAGRIDDCWNAGLLYNGFAERLQQAVAAAAIPRLYVLNAAGPGEIAWAAPELGGTPFGYFVAQGLAGDASGGDNIITLGELVGYVRRNVSDWTLLHRGSRQRPMLVPELGNDDFQIAYAGRSSSAVPEEESLPERSSELTAVQHKIAQLWDEFDRYAAAQDLVRQDPWRLADMQHQLLRAEQLLWAGQAYRGELDATLGQVQSQLAEQSRPPWPAGVSGLSLPLALRFSPAVEPDGQRAALLTAWQSAGGKPAVEEGQPPPPRVSYLAAADVGTRFLAGVPQANPDRLQEVLEFVGSRPRPAAATDGRPAAATPELIEIQFLGMLRRYLDWPGASSGQAGLAAVVPQAIAARRAAEAAAAPQDLRTWLWVQPLIEGADKLRRELEDQLFATGTEGVEQLQPQYAQLLAESATRGSYAEAAARAAEISRYYAARDAAWSELAYLGQWLARQAVRPPLEILGQDPARQLEQLRQLAEATQSLASALDRCLIERSAEPSDELRLAAERVQQLHGGLRKEYLQFCNYLEQAGEDRLTLKRIGEALRVPLLDARRRASLMRVYSRILFAPADLARADQAADPGAADGDAGFERYRQALAGWREHPAVALLDPRDLKLLPGAVASAADEPEGEGLLWAAWQGGVVRRRLAQLPTDLNQLERVTRERLAQADETPANIRAGLSQAERLARAAATLAPGLPAGGSSPTRQLALVDLHFLLLGHGWRVTEDFWGSEETGDPYFARAAAAYLAAARLVDRTPRSLRHQGVDLNRLLAARRQAARQVTLQVEDALTLQSDESVPHQLQVRWAAAAVEGTSGGGATGGDLPTGLAAAFVQVPATSAGARRLLPLSDETGQWLIRRHPLAAPGEANRCDLKFRLPLEGLDSSGAGADLDAVCLYRGHVYRQRFRVLWPPWVTRVEVPPRQPSPASITVEGAGQRTGHIMFVFDCSGSMEVKGRMQTAKASLREVLEALLAGARCEVGLRAYGRRAKFIDANNLNLRRYVAPAWEGLVHPDTDVERLLECRPLDRRHHEALLAKLDELQPFGQTPLYLALRKAFDEGDFAQAGADEPKRLVVITDGVNLQTERLEGSMQEVLAAHRAGGSDVQIDIVGLDVEADLKPADRHKLAELRELAKLTGGRYYPARDSASLIEALQQALQLVTYRVSGPGADGAADRRNLGERWPLPEPLSPPTTYDVRLLGIDRAPAALVQIEGGEALLLQYDAARNRLFYPRYQPRRYDPSDDVRGELLVCEDPAGSGSYTVQALLPRRLGRDVAFYAYLQHDDDRTFTRRPQHVRAEIRPVGADAERVYYFSDPDFVPQRPVPVLRFVAQDWPPAALEADLKLWVKLDPRGAEPEWKGQVDPLRTQAIELPRLPGIRFEISSKSHAEGGYSVLVVERHPLNEPVEPARVRTTPPPDELLRHEYAGRVNVLKHEFRFAGPTPVEVDITSRDQLLRGALDVPPLRIRVER